MIEELNAADDIIQYYAGESTVPFFRAPYGDVNSSVLEAVGDAGYDYTIGWSIDTLDWQGLSADTIINTVVNNIHPGAIVLMHAMPGAANVFCKTFLHNIAKKKYTPLRLKFFSDYFGLDRAFLSRKLSPVKLKMCA